LANRILVIGTPPASIHAVWGGLVATRASIIGLAGAVIEGRVEIAMRTFLRQICPFGLFQHLPPLERPSRKEGVVSKDFFKSILSQHPSP
jgi:hypothetical protein